MATDYAPFVDFKQRKCLQTQRNVSPENVTGTNLADLPCVGTVSQLLLGSCSPWTRSTAVVQHLHTVLVVSSSLTVSTKQGKNNE